MNLHTALRAALRALTANLLRSVLTMLGIIIGVGAVITMLAVGRGATERVQEQIKGLGSNIVLVVPGSLSAAGVRLGAQTRSRFTEEDAEALAREVPEVQVAAPSSRTGAQVVAGNTNWSTSIFGTTMDYLEARDWPLAAGRGFEAADVAGSAWRTGARQRTLARPVCGHRVVARPGGLGTGRGPATCSSMRTPRCTAVRVRNAGRRMAWIPTSR